jgi:superoxide dismutase, Cu-Zn family
MKYFWIIAVLAAASSAHAATGLAELKATSSTSTVHGTVVLADTPAGLHLKATLSDVPPGTHAFHIHEFGSCADRAKAAGSHYNPLGAPHGQVLKTDIHHAHAGDLGNVTADAGGHAAVEATIPGVTLSSSPYTVAGRAFILHEKVDDFSQPAGNAGGRIACGPIVLTSGPAAP